MPPGDDDIGSDDRVIQQARERAMGLLSAVGGDLDALRAAASDARYAEGAALCDEIADATRQLMAQLGADLQQQHPLDQSSNQSPRP
jgi:hypothetical protein